MRYMHSFPYTVERRVVERGVGRLGARGGGVGKEDGYIKRQLYDLDDDVF